LGSIQEEEDSKDDGVIAGKEDQEVPKYMGKNIFGFPCKKNHAKECPLRSAALMEVKGK